MKNCRELSIALVIGAFTLSLSNVYAEEAVLDTVQIIGETPSSFATDLAGSVDVLSQEELTYERVDDTLELFNKAPGVSLSRYNQGVINTDISIRGFAGDGVTPHAKLLIDGIPANLHNGYNELDQLFPLSISSIEVFKGTSDPRYGLYNIAGNYNVVTRQDDAKEINLTLGSFNTQEAQGYAGFSNDGFIQSYAAGYRTSKGYRDRTDLDKYALAGSWEWQFDDAKEFRVIVRHAAYEGDSPGYLTEEQAREKPEQSASFANEDGGDKETNHLSAHWSQAINTDLRWQLKTYIQTFERERWVRFSETSSLQNRYDDQEQWGLISTLSWFLSDSWSMVWGADYEFQDVIEQRFSTIDNSRQRDSATRDRTYDFITYGTYLQLFHEPNDNLRWNIALRADRLDGDYRDPSGTREMFDFETIIQPKFNIVYAPSAIVNVFANAGRSFQHPFGMEAYEGADGDSRDVSINDGWEVGVQWSPSTALTARLSYWEQNASDEFVEVDGTKRNVGETDRCGVDLSFNGKLTEDLSYWGNYAIVDTEIARAADSLSDTEGNELRGIPSFVASIGLNYQATPKLVTRIHVDAQGDYYVNEANLGGQFGDYTILSVSADYNTAWGKVQLQLNNLTDEFYRYVYDFSKDGTSIIHSPGDGINGSLSVSWNL